MDVSDATAPGYDLKCLPVNNPGGLTEDYIFIPKAEVNEAQPLKANIFCSNTITGKEITCNITNIQTIRCISLIIVTFSAHARGPLVIEVNTDKKTTQNMETGFRFRYKIA